MRRTISVISILLFMAIFGTPACCQDDRPLRATSVKIGSKETGKDITGFLLKVDPVTQEIDSNAIDMSTVAGEDTERKVKGDAASPDSASRLGTYRWFHDRFYGLGHRTYLMSSFDNNQETLRILASTNLRDWRLISDTGYGAGELRDPAIMQYNGRFYVVYTAGNFGAVDYCVVIGSDDLREWFPVDTVHTGERDGVLKTWSPRWFIDQGDIYIIVGLNRFGSTRFQMYYLKALNSDLTEWSRPEYILGGFNRYYQDGTIFKYKNQYHFVYNDYWYRQTHDDYRGTVGYSVSDTPLHGYRFVDWLFNGEPDPQNNGTGFEGPALITKEDTVFMFFDSSVDINNGGSNNGVYYTYSVDDLATWSTPAPITSDAPTVNQNARVIEIASMPPLAKEYADWGERVSRVEKRSAPAVEGAMRIVNGFPEKPDTLMVFDQGDWVGFPSTKVSPEKSLWNPNNPDCVLHFTFNGEVAESHGVPFKPFGPADRFVTGPTPGIGAIDLSDSSYFEINNSDLPSDFSGEFTVSALIYLLKKNVGAHHVLNKRLGPDGFQTVLSSNPSLQIYLRDQLANVQTHNGAVYDTLEWFIATWRRTTGPDSILLSTNYIERTLSANTVIGDLTTTGNIHIGANYPAAPTVFFHGYMAELSVWDVSRPNDSLIADIERLHHRQLKRTTVEAVNPFTNFFFGDSLIYRIDFENDNANEKFGHTVNVSGSPSYADGYFGSSTTRAIYLDNTVPDFLTTPDTATLDFDGGFSIAAVIRIDESTPFSDFWRVVNKRNAFDGYGLTIHQTQAEVEAFLGDGSDFTFATPGSAILSGNTWYWIVVVYDFRFGRFMLYVDGKFIADEYWDSDISGIDNTGDLIIGRYPAANENFLGWIDEVAVWNKALSSPEIDAMWKKLLKQSAAESP